MENRRTILMGLTGALFGAGRAFAASEAAAPADDDTPKATVLPGKPPVLDFGDGVKVPCSKAAFLTLWEGKTYWLTFGAGRASYALRANGEAMKFAAGAMKLLLMTMAFAPERLEKVEGGGWRLKVQDEINYIHGDIALPGKPFWPISDANLGFGTLDDLNLTGDSKTFGGYGVDPAATAAQVDAFCAYVIKKRDADLGYVITHAQLLAPQPKTP
jgi:hypothetical protein